MSSPLLTISIISCNRLYFLRSLIESIRECLEIDEVEWIVVDNASIEEGLRDYLNGLGFLDHVILRTERDPSNEFTLSYNEIVEKASGRYFLLLTDDMQFIYRGPWLGRVMELAERNRQIGSIVLNAQRRPTIDRFFRRKGMSRWLLGGKSAGRFVSDDGKVTLLSYGDQKPGIAPAVANCLIRTEIVKEIGPIEPGSRQTVQDAGGGFEDMMLARYEEIGGGLERCLIQVPLTAAIITDSRGTQARIRGNRRYGAYLAPVDGKYYYRINGPDAYLSVHPEEAAAFEDVVEPIGFQLPIDKHGHLLKKPHGEGDEFEWIDPSVAGVDI